MTVDRRTLFFGAGVAGLAAALPGCMTTGAPVPGATSGFVTADGMRLMRGGQPYRIVGANMWYAAWLGANAAYGDRGRLTRELDRLQSLGVNNLRIMASGEEGPLDNSIKPGFTGPEGEVRKTQYEGLDFAMAEIGRRGMTAVLVLSNFWEWSGGLQTLLWRATGQYMDMGDPDHPWPDFPDATSAFYGNEQAVELYNRHLRSVVERTNTVTGRKYVDDPAIMAWQHANEPRLAGRPDTGATREASYYRWIDDTAALIRSLDPNHLVSLGQEGTAATLGDANIVKRAHRDIDYLTAHIWPLNWGWVAGDDLAGTWPTAESNTADYLAQHRDLATQLNKPLLIEEFGFPRDGEAYSPRASTEFRERFYATIYAAVEESWVRGGPIQGSNFWAWNGEARAAHEDAKFRDGDLQYMGDPPHEPQGWYGNFDTDAEMLALIRNHARAATLV